MEGGRWTLLCLSPHWRPQSRSQCIRRDSLKWFPPCARRSIDHSFSRFLSPRAALCLCISPNRVVSLFPAGFIPVLIVRWQNASSVSPFARIDCPFDSAPGTLRGVLIARFRHPWLQPLFQFLPTRVPLLFRLGMNEHAPWENSLKQAEAEKRQRFFTEGHEQWTRSRVAEILR